MPSTAGAVHAGGHAVKASSLNLYTYPERAIDRRRRRSIRAPQLLRLPAIERPFCRLLRRSLSCPFSLPLTPPPTTHPSLMFRKKRQKSDTFLSLVIVPELMHPLFLRRSSPYLLILL